MKLSSFTVKAVAASLLLVSTTGLALAGANYKGERNLKGEIPCPPPPVLRDGLYVGVQGGYDSFRVRENIGDVANPVINATGGVGGVFIGYGMDFGDMFNMGAFYLGAEAFGNYSGVDTSYTLGTNDPAVGLYTSNFKSRGEWGVSLLPGIKLSPALLAYVRLGYNWASLRTNESYADATGAVSDSKNNTSGGFNYGVGLESLVMDNWSVRGEYSHTDYNSFNSNVTHFNPSDNQFMASIIYHWMI